jgi:hypothetical protein
MPSALIAALVALALLPASADAASRSVPRGWLGVTVDGPMTDGVHGTDAEWDLLAGSGAESARMSVRWPELQPSEGAPLELARLDANVLAAARRGVGLLPVVQDTPGWAASRPSEGRASPPRDPADYGALLRGLVRRYGPSGTLWTEHPEVRKQPIRHWQVWNEPNLTLYWARRPFAPTYVKLLRAARKALRSADPGARVVLAGLPNDSWVALRRIYAAGGRGTFDAVALHPYTGRPRNGVKLVEFARRVMRRYHDARRPIWVTELSWPAAQGKVEGRTPGFETTEAGQASKLRTGVRLMASARRRLRIERVYWYTWLSEEKRGSAFNWSGLRRLRDGRVVSAPSLSAFQAVARGLEGCAKAPGDARRCR